MADVSTGLKMLAQVGSFTAFLPPGAATYVAALGICASAVYGFVFQGVDLQHTIEAFLTGTGIAGLRRGVSTPNPTP
jgi:hypothetical protein